MSDTIRLFVGTSARNEDLEAMMVLAYTAQKHASLPIEITWMRQSATDPIWGGWNATHWRTPFSGFRWAPPSVCGFQGRAIYTDVDFFFLGDLAELWTQDIPGSAIMAMKGPDGKMNNSSCILFDNAKCRGHIPALKQLKPMADTHGEMLQYLRPLKNTLIKGFDGDWNCTAYEKMRPGADIPLKLDDVKAYHFTRIEHQLHLRYALPRLKAEGRTHWYTGPVYPHPHAGLVALYDALYHEALDAGFTLDQFRSEAFEGATRKAFTYQPRQAVSA